MNSIIKKKWNSVSSKFIIQDSMSLKFPDDFLRSKFSTFKESLKNRKYSPKVFTEQGVYMLATILKSGIAIQITISIIRAFAQMRKVVHNNIFIQEQLKELGKKWFAFSKFEIESFDILEKLK